MGKKFVVRVGRIARTPTTEDSEELKSKGVHFEDADAPKYYAPTDRKLATTFDADGRKCIQLVEVKP